MTLCCQWSYTWHSYFINVVRGSNWYQWSCQNAHPNIHMNHFRILKCDITVGKETHSELLALLCRESICHRLNTLRKSQLCGPLMFTSLLFGQTLNKRFCWIKSNIAPGLVIISVTQLLSRTIRKSCKWMADDLTSSVSGKPKNLEMI